MFRCSLSNFQGAQIVSWRKCPPARVTRGFVVTSLGDIHSLASGMMRSACASSVEGNECLPSLLSRAVTIARMTWRSRSASSAPSESALALFRRGLDPRIHAESERESTAECACRSQIYLDWLPSTRCRSYKLRVLEVVSLLHVSDKLFRRRSIPAQQFLRGPCLWRKMLSWKGWLVALRSMPEISATLSAVMGFRPKRLWVGKTCRIGSPSSESRRSRWRLVWTRQVFSSELSFIDAVVWLKSVPGDVSWLSTDQAISGWVSFF